LGHLVDVRKQEGGIEKGRRGTGIPAAVSRGIIV